MAAHAVRGGVRPGAQRRGEGIPGRREGLDGRGPVPPDHAKDHPTGRPAARAGPARGRVRPGSGERAGSPHHGPGRGRDREEPARRRVRGRAGGGGDRARRRGQRLRRRRHLRPDRGDDPPPARCGTGHALGGGPGAVGEAGGGVLRSSRGRPRRRPPRAGPGPRHGPTGFRSGAAVGREPGPIRGVREDRRPRAQPLPRRGDPGRVPAIAGGPGPFGPGGNRPRGSPPGRAGLHGHDRAFPQGEPAVAAPGGVRGA